jgi:hypothetical protein
MLVSMVILVIIMAALTAPIPNVEAIQIARQEREVHQMARIAESDDQGSSVGVDQERSFRENQAGP